MRITPGMMRERLVRSLGNTFAQLARAQLHVATGKRIHKASDDVTAARQIMRISGDIRALDQFRRNTTFARTRLNAEEAVLNQVTDILSRAREIATAQATDTATTHTREIAAAEVEQLLDQVVQLGNTVLGKTHLFAGHQAQAAAFLPDGTYQGDTGHVETAISPDQRVVMNHTGDELLVTSGVIDALTALLDGLRAGTIDAVRDAGPQLAAAFDEAQFLLTETGARIQRLDAAASIQDSRQLDLTANRQALEEVGLEQAAVELFEQETLLQATLASASRILGTTLLDYIR